MLVGSQFKKDPELPDVPLLMDLPTNPEDRAALRLLSAPTSVGRPLFLPPGVPEERVKALRAAFDKAMEDADFKAEAKKQKLDLQPMSGEEVQKLVADIVATPKAVVDRLNQAISFPAK